MKHAPASVREDHSPRGNARFAKVRSVDWVALIQQLRQSQTIPQIAQGSGLAKTVVIGIGNGYNRPRHENGETLIAYWTQQTGKSREDLPYA
jgi:hypothetical protein